ncbi:MAG TPA: hypothetical protein VK039_13285, partial [Brevibacterium sp.]|nr:hypothetical protein [Brevibacterium sp.]
MTPLVTTDAPLDAVLDPELAERLTAAFGHQSVGDLLHTLPRRFRQHGQRYDRRQLVEGERITVIGTVSGGRSRTYASRGGQPREMYTFSVVDGGTEFRVVFFSAGRLKFLLPEGTRAMFDGVVSLFRGRPELKHPEFLVLRSPRGSRHEDGHGLRGSGNLAELARLSAQIDSAGGPSLFDRSFLPVYAAKENVTSWEILGAVVAVLSALVPVVDPLDRAVRADADLMDLDEALRKAHLPNGLAEKDRASRRLRFDEALALQLLLGARKRFAARDPAPASGQREDGLRAAMAARLPFELTAGQRAVLGEISGDLSREEPMNRLLQGEVGSG